MEDLDVLNYMTEGGSSTLAYRDRAIEALKVAKELESKKDTIPVWYDSHTIKLVDKKKIEKYEMQILKVKIPGGRIVWMEKQNAKDKGFINN